MSEPEDVIVAQDNARAGLQLQRLVDQSAIDKRLALLLGNDAHHTCEGGRECGRKIVILRVQQQQCLLVLVTVVCNHMIEC